MQASIYIIIPKLIQFGSLICAIQISGQICNNHLQLQCGKLFIIMLIINIISAIYNIFVRKSTFTLQSD